MLLADSQIAAYATLQEMITPYVPELVRIERSRRVISYGQSSYGYDIRLSPKEFFTFQRVPGEFVDPKHFDPRSHLRSAHLRQDEHGGRYFVLPAHSYGLGVALERFKMPRNVTGIILGKSTYARCGIIVNATPAEPAWIGHLTLEFSNSSDSDCRIYANEGVAQALFLEGDVECEVSYADRAGKYQNQPESVVVPKL